MIKSTKNRGIAFLIFSISLLTIGLYIVANRSQANQDETNHQLSNSLFGEFEKTDHIYFIEFNDKPIMELDDYNEEVLSCVEGDISFEEKKRLDHIKGKIEEYHINMFKKIKKIDANAVLRERYDFIVNGISIIANDKSVEAIGQLEGVKSISRASEVTPVGKVENIDFGQFNQSYKNDLMGKGIVIAIIDSGVESIDGFTLVDEEGVKLERHEIHGQGKYFSAKIPYGYNYADNNTDIIAKEGDYHGQVVATIIGGHQQQDEGRTRLIKGVAPNAQLLILKVFANSIRPKGEYSDVLISAIEDAIEHGADIINMSVGLRNIIDGEIEGKVLNVVKKQGILMVASAGNSSFTSYPFNIGTVLDDGTIHSPGRSKEMIGVGAARKTNEEKVDKFAYNYEMLRLSSWGPTYDLRIKPDVTATGVVPLVPTQEQPAKTTQGTSFAAPVISGQLALLLEKMDQQSVEFKEGLHRIEFIRSSLMNTAMLLIGKEDTPYSIRNQGAGLIYPEMLMTNLITMGQNNTGKIELGSFTNKKIVFSFEIKNYYPDEVTCQVTHGGIYTNNPETERYTSMPILTENKITFDTEKFSIPAGESQIINGTLEMVKDFPIDQYIESFIMLETSKGIDLTAPLLGFYGDFANLDVFDKWRWEKGSLMKRAGIYELNCKDQLFDVTEGLENEKNGTVYLSNRVPGVFVKIDLLRHVKDFSLHLFTEKKQLVYEIAHRDLVTKTFWLEDEAWIEDNKDISKIKLTNIYPWIFTQKDAKGNHINLKDGKYFIRASGTPLASGAKTQTKEISIVMDSTPPKISDIKIDKRTDYLKVDFKAKDEMSAIKKIRIIYQDGTYEDIQGDELKGLKKTFGGYSIKLESPQSQIKLRVFDFAGNHSTFEV